MQNSNEEIIDLTSLDVDSSSCNKRRRLISGAVIDLADETVNDKNQHTDTITTKRKKPSEEPAEKTIDKTNESNLFKLGLCTLCFHMLGKRPLASTKCGHVFCLVCIENAFQRLKRCPTCTHRLRGRYPYHPLYIELG